MFLKCAQIIAGALIGCSAGFLNSVKIKGTHTAMKSGILLAETLMRSYSDGFKADYESADYESAVHSSWIGDELKVVRNSHPSFRWGLLAGIMHTAFSCFISGTHFSASIVMHALLVFRWQRAMDYPQ